MIPIAKVTAMRTMNIFRPEPARACRGQVRIPRMDPRIDVIPLERAAACEAYRMESRILAAAMGHVKRHAGFLVFIYDSKAQAESIKTFLGSSKDERSGCSENRIYHGNALNIGEKSSY
jgi:hypothetical protein